MLLLWLGLVLLRSLLSVLLEACLQSKPWKLRFGNLRKRTSSRLTCTAFMRVLSVFLKCGLCYDYLCFCSDKDQDRALFSRRMSLKHVGGTGQLSIAHAQPSELEHRSFWRLDMGGIAILEKQSGSPRTNITNASSPCISRRLLSPMRQ